MAPELNELVQEWLRLDKTSQGLAEYLLATDSKTAKSGVVIGHDARHNSEKFAEHAAAVFVQKGIKVWWYEGYVHTPMVPFAVKDLRAAAGIMITASHNPSQDNGYKVYGSNGAQINSPVDSAIATSIAQNLQPEVWGLDGSIHRRENILLSMKPKYRDTLTSQVELSQQLQNTPRFVYTPLHGVGLPFFVAALDQIQLSTSMVPVEEQADPNPDFPTVKYPNPEEEGALSLAMSAADRRDTKFVIANDPDADRFAVAEKLEDRWNQFTGDQVGCLLAYYIFSASLQPMNMDDCMLSSAVSSQMLGVMGQEEGFQVVETLTGFKWLGNIALELQKAGKRVHFAYEEAQGYMIPNVVLDKDGIAAAILFLSACASWGSPWAKLQQLYERYGYFETMNTYWRSPNFETTSQAFERIRAFGKPYPPHVGSRKVLRWRDLTQGYDSATDDNIPSLPCSKSSQMITCWLSGMEKDQGIRFTVRASGTEPKIKLYLECRGKDRASAIRGALEILRLMREDWFSNPELIMEEKYNEIL
ncbi:MAG: hypothetical protein LQ351_007383 [Letrouitia transgressa]|nr:MAG: hypothetical protein LQ351_007383 [Letrouitia transgressa]